MSSLESSTSSANCGAVTPSMGNVTGAVTLPCRLCTDRSWADRDFCEVAWVGLRIQISKVGCAFRKFARRHSSAFKGQ